jgi:hypothetical protein
MIPRFLAASKDFPHQIGVAANLVMASITDAQGRTYISGESFTASRKVRGVSIAAEVFHTTIGRLEGSEVAMDLGLSRVLGKNMQIDVEAGRTIAGMRPSWFATMGFVYRNPHALLGPAWFRFR